jgi:predicted metal-dependent phosphoesterase TrpH
MSVDVKPQVRVELHVHTRYSKDSLVDIPRFLAHCRKIGIDRIAITDHNEIDGAFEAYQIAPERVIVGEEIKTTQGELLGYYMREKVPAGLGPMEAIRRLKDQGAVISVAHPFDVVRSQHWALEELEKITPYIDAIETYNARCLSEEPNQQAAVFAREHNLLATAGSDAHSLLELGRANLWMSPFDGPESFRTALRTAEREARLSPPFVHLFSRYAVTRKKIAAIRDRASRERPS